MDPRPSRIICPLLIATALAGCGGGSGSGSGADARRPTADAGPDQNVPTNTIVALDGTGSTGAGGGPLSYDWTLESAPPGSTASLDDTAAVIPTFSPDREGPYSLTLIVRDGASTSFPDTVTVLASGGNVPPVAAPGPDQDVATGSIVTLRGVDSTDADGDRLAYEWTLVSVPDGSTAELVGGSTRLPTFVADLDGRYVAELVVHDGIESSAPRTVTVVSTMENVPPVARAGDDREVAVGAAVTLDGSASTDAEGEGIAYRWAFVSMPDGSTASLDEPTAMSPQFTADVEGSYVLSLSVGDGESTGTPDNIRVDAILPSVELLRENGGFFGDGAFNPVPFPYSSSSSTSANVAGIPAPTTYTLDTFVLRARGGTFTIENVAATDDTGQVSPYFSEPLEGREIRDGDELAFELVSPLTQGAQVSLRFGFDIRETGERFSTSYIFSSN